MLSVTFPSGILPLNKQSWATQSVPPFLLRCICPAALQASGAPRSRCAARRTDVSPCWLKPLWTILRTAWGRTNRGYCVTRIGFMSLRPIRPTTSSTSTWPCPRNFGEDLRTWTTEGCPLRIIHGANGNNLHPPGFESIPAPPRKLIENTVAISPRPPF